jgi:RimJ/RimL family protein N-acetyltransferase
MRILTTPDFSLEPLVAAHAAGMFVVLGDPAIYEFENQPPPSEEWLAGRYRKLEARCSPDGTQRWLNWVIRLHGGELAGYVQATVLPDGASLIAYELSSRHWRRGIGSTAVSTMLAELEGSYGVGLFVAILKQENYRSLGLLRSLSFRPGSLQLRQRFEVPPDEALMVRQSAQPGRFAPG